ncbi:MAG: glycosyltransferase [Evtepia gabavorous]
MKILLTCGGTAGHINPRCACGPGCFKQRMEDSQVLFAGPRAAWRSGWCPRSDSSGDGDHQLLLAQSEPVLPPAQPADPAESIGVQKGGRPDSGRLSAGPGGGDGGYASYPVVHEAARRGIPTAVHESNAVPGLTTPAHCAKVADRVMVGYEGLPAAGHYIDPDRGGGHRDPGPGGILPPDPAAGPGRPGHPG